MGDPAIVRFWTNTEDEHPLSLYLHWGGAVAATLADALVMAKGRWDDPDYATRMAVQSILKDMHIDATDLGAGLFVGTADAGGPVLNVNWEGGRVWSEGWAMSFQQYMRNDGNVWEKVQGE